MKLYNNSHYIVDRELVEEDWYEIDGYRAYLVSTLGRVKRREHRNSKGTWILEHIMQPVKNRKGTTYRLMDDRGRRRYISIEMLMKDL